MNKLKLFFLSLLTEPRVLYDAIVNGRPNLDKNYWRFTILGLLSNSDPDKWKSGFGSILRKNYCLLFWTSNAAVVLTLALFIPWLLYKLVYIPLYYLNTWLSPKFEAAGQRRTLKNEQTARGKHAVIIDSLFDRGQVVSRGTVNTDYFSQVNTLKHYANSGSVSELIQALLKINYGEEEFTNYYARHKGTIKSLKVSALPVSVLEVIRWSFIRGDETAEEMDYGDFNIITSLISFIKMHPRLEEWHSVDYAVGFMTKVAEAKWTAWREIAELCTFRTRMYEHDMKCVDKKEEPVKKIPPTPAEKSKTLENLVYGFKKVVSAVFLLGCACVTAFVLYLTWVYALPWIWVQLLWATTLPGKFIDFLMVYMTWEATLFAFKYIVLPFAVVGGLVYSLLSYNFNPHLSGVVNFISKYLGKPYFMDRGFNIPEEKEKNAYLAYILFTCILQLVGLFIFPFLLITSTTIWLFVVLKPYLLFPFYFVKMMYTKSCPIIQYKEDDAS